MQDIAQDKYVPKTDSQNKLPKLNARVAVPKPMRKRIAMAILLPTAMPRRTQMRQRYSEHGHTTKWHNEEATPIVNEHREASFRPCGTYLLKNKCSQTLMKLNVLCVSKTLCSACHKIFTNPKQNYGHWNTMSKCSKSCNANQTTSNRKDNGG